jgi:hypothetical protein
MTTEAESIIKLEPALDALPTPEFSKLFISEYSMALTIQTDISPTETRGRPPSEEHIALLKMPIGGSFASPKRREALYQLARSLGVRVKILEDAETKGYWRVWKRSLPGQPKSRRKTKKVDK